MVQYSGNNRLVSHLVGLERLVELERERDIGLKSLSVITDVDNIVEQESSSDVIGGSLEYNGITTAVRVSANIFSGVDISATGYSIEFWFKYSRNQNTERANLFSFSGMNTSLWMIQETGRLSVRILGTDFTNLPIVQENLWHYLVFQHSNGASGSSASIRLMSEDLNVDEDSGEITLSNTIPSNQSVSEVLVGSAGFIGFLDDFIVWEGTFPLAEERIDPIRTIDSRFNSGVGEYIDSDSRSLLLLHLDDLTGASVYDSSTALNHGELIDAHRYDYPTWSTDGKIPLPDLPIIRRFTGASVPIWGQTTWGGSVWF